MESRNASPERHGRIVIFLEQEMTDADRNPQPTLDLGSGTHLAAKRVETF
jgi:hypothetical protein